MKEDIGSGHLILEGKVDFITDRGIVLRVQGVTSEGEGVVYHQEHLGRFDGKLEIPLDSAYSDYVVNIQGLLQWSILGNTVVNGHWVETEVLVRVCDEVGDQYRFGFNGMEKVNEISGMGNHNTAEFWEYDTRLGRRWNLDPVDQISVSNYAVNGLNPIMNTDPLGNVFNKWDTRSSKKEFRFNSHFPTNTKYFADEANLNSFSSAAFELVRTNEIFAQVYSQLAKSENVYIIQQEYTSTPNYKAENRTINMTYRGVGKDAYISKTEVFEEIFHAGQDEYYSQRGIIRSLLEDEVEAKVADIISGYQDDAVKQEYNSIKNYFKTGKKDKGFDKNMDDLINDVYQLYSDYDRTTDKKWGKENDPKKVDRKNVLKYLETLTPATKDK